MYFYGLYFVLSLVICNYNEILKTENRTLTLRTVREIEQNLILNDKNGYSFFDEVLI